jgi:RNA processing factor Prp31
MDKDLNTLCMRIREWYSWHFPELSKIVKDNITYVKIAHLLGNRKLYNPDGNDLVEITNDPEQADLIIRTSKSSMGCDVSEFDMEAISRLTSRAVSFNNYKIEVSEYLIQKMNDVAPNLSALIGEIVAARLINHSGSLTNLAKCPASTIQILGAEKALFRALKSRKGNTPKYGIIFNSTFISRAKARDKGRISRYLANKCAIAARLDCFYDNATNIFGVALREQVEQRLVFYDTGKAPPKNVDVMHEVLKQAADLFPEEEVDGDNNVDLSAKRKRKDDMDVDDSDEPKRKKSKKEKKKEKRKSKGKNKE